MLEKTGPSPARRRPGGNRHLAGALPIRIQMTQYCKSAGRAGIDTKVQVVLVEHVRFEVRF